MKKVLVILLVVLLLLVAVAPSAWAAGDKVHGEKAQGPAEQHGECPYGGEDAGENNSGPGPFN